MTVFQKEIAERAAEPFDVDKSASPESEVRKAYLQRQPSTTVDEQRTARSDQVGLEKKERLTDDIFKLTLDGALDDALRVATAKQHFADSDAIIDRATLDRVKQLASGHLNELPSPRSLSLSPRQTRDRFMAIAAHSPRSPRSPGAVGHVSIPILFF